MINSINKVKNSKIYTSPFPHLAISDFLDKDIVNNLHKELKDNLYAEKTQKSGNEIVKESTQQFGSYSIKHKELVDNPKMQISAKVNKFFNSPEFMTATVEKLYGYIKTATNFDKNYVLEKIKNNSFSSELGFVPPSTLSVKRREVHLDAPEVILGFLYYVRLPEDYSMGGSLNLLQKEERYLFKSKFKSLISDFLNIYPSDLSIEKTYDYEDNRLIVMCASGYSWHEVTTRRFANTPRITFHGSLINSGEDKKFTNYDLNPNLVNPLKNKLKHIFNFFK